MKQGDLLFKKHPIEDASQQCQKKRGAHQLLEACEQKRGKGDDIFPCLHFSPLKLLDQGGDCQKRRRQGPGIVQGSGDESRLPGQMEGIDEPQSAQKNILCQAPLGIDQTEKKDRNGNGDQRIQEPPENREARHKDQQPLNGKARGPKLIPLVQKAGPVLKAELIPRQDLREPGIVGKIGGKDEMRHDHSHPKQIQWKHGRMGVLFQSVHALSSSDSSLMT